MQNEGLPGTQWQMGKNKIFLRCCIHEPLEDKRLRLLNGAATKIQKTWKGQRQRRRFVEIRKATKKIQESFMAWRLRIQFIKRRRAAIVIQAHLRGMFAREVATALREAKRVEEERRRQEALEAERKRRELERQQELLQEAALDEAER
jgi:myosin heavy subunit